MGGVHASLNHIATAVVIARVVAIVVIVIVRVVAAEESEAMTPEVAVVPEIAIMPEAAIMVEAATTFAAAETAIMGCHAAAKTAAVATMEAASAHAHAAVVTATTHAAAVDTASATTVAAVAATATTATSAASAAARQRHGWRSQANGRNQRERSAETVGLQTPRNPVAASSMTCRAKATVRTNHARPNPDAALDCLTSMVKACSADSQPLRRIRQSKTKAPSPPAPIKAATTASPIVCTTTMRSPASNTGSARGSSICQKS